MGGGAPTFGGFPWGGFRRSTLGLSWQGGGANYLSSDRQVVGQFQLSYPTTPTLHVLSGSSAIIPNRGKMPAAAGASGCA